MNRSFRTVRTSAACWAVSWGCVLTASTPVHAAPPSAEVGLEKYNVVWDSPSADAHGSMPIGNGDVGINAWVEPSGDLVFYVSQTDAWDENGRLCKIGRVRVKFDPPLPVSESFRQELKLHQGMIEIAAGSSRLTLRVDAHQPVVLVEAESAEPVACRAEVELWRRRQRPFGAEDDSHSGKGLNHATSPLVILPDVVVASDAPRVVWYHRNTRSIYPLCLKNQHLEALQGRFPDPLLDRTFGASLGAEGFVRDGAQAIRSAAPARRHVLTVVVLNAKTDTPDAWLARLDRLTKQSLLARDAHEAWWQAFWERSWVFADGAVGTPLPVNTHPWRVGVASDGGSRFGGETRQPRVIGRALTPDEIAALAKAPPGESTQLQEEVLSSGCTALAWIKPSAREAGRILDKCTAGKPDGLTFDTHPGLSLRWIVGPETMIAPDCLKAGQWQHVAATVDAATGLRRLYLDGRLLLEERGESRVETLIRGYVLQRCMNACSGRGRSPIKFNGSIFTVEARPGADPETPEGDPDWRRWGGNYWFQNTRLA